MSRAEDRRARREKRRKNKEKRQKCESAEMSKCHKIRKHIVTYLETESTIVNGCYVYTVGIPTARAATEEVRRSIEKTKGDKWAIMQIVSQGKARIKDIAKD